jgi:hypothetical protein
VAVADKFEFAYICTDNLTIQWQNQCTYCLTRQFFSTFSHKIQAFLKQVESMHTKGKKVNLILPNEKAKIASIV